MRKDRLNALFRAYARNQLSPTPDERQFVVEVYASVCEVIGAANALQIGSYPRFTAISPLHDLDVLYILGRWDPQRHDPGQALADLEARMRAEYVNPTRYEVRIARQTHSVTVQFFRGEDQVLGVDIVPAYIEGRNPAGDDMYVVPEIAVRAHRDRRAIREAVSRGEREMAWIRTDPRGYITSATRLNQANDDFRLSVKFAKGWRHHRKSADDEFPLKSFHLEQIITGWVADHPEAEIFDIVFEFFRRLPDYMRYPQIPDRADPDRNIDEYVAHLSHADRRRVDHARDGFLTAVENFEDGDDVGALLSAEPRERKSDEEAYLFDQGVPMLNEHDFSIAAEVLPREGGFRGFFLDRFGLIRVDRKIRFRLGNDAPAADVFKWKVKNDDDSPDPRGEITDHQTRNDPESTKYNGIHFVECYAIRNGACIGKARQNVVLQRGTGPT